MISCDGSVSGGVSVSVYLKRVQWHVPVYFAVADGVGDVVVGLVGEEVDVVVAVGGVVDFIV